MAPPTRNLFYCYTVIIPSVKDNQINKYNERECYYSLTLAQELREPGSNNMRFDKYTLFLYPSSGLSLLMCNILSLHKLALGRILYLRSFSLVISPLISLQTLI